ncbi:1,2-phenylacetyl-CoA epoxidase subunit PaaC [Paenactinomyces guangxiensis]|uniref:Phenylacetate-CoA oxygenase subunit PaaC n=1 Tax=Paenactinomyces guangxiensis TaxID=1490290 RepID=A0A7W1WNZ7_9BACL|nr:1,2-phenylacetyl-CoA epoxidase subunit PaaC [Paenactinomyces guangxiensis]MBA4493404.1 phenylacetate-CoA oxygenase subunit PaaC [Paenactinomyces guangxiensis]MBH8590495.1 phenylacetate-CoA oxygenase subunit PaaC [Paenactinomyces guangxiensis]
MRIENAAQAKENEKIMAMIRDLLFQAADDELTIGHRDSEWLGLCPDIEGDVAFSSIAQDEVGHAVFFFELLHDLGEKDPDYLAFMRQGRERHNAVLLERGNGDWAYSVVRHYFYDVFDDLRLQAMLDSRYLPLAQGAAKIRREEQYHLLHMHMWFTRLGKAGGEAGKRLEKAVADIWPDLGGLFCFGPYEQELVEQGVLAAGSGEIRQRWMNRMRTSFAEAGLSWPGEIPKPHLDGRYGQHSEDLEELLSEMAEVYRLDPEAHW